MPPPTRFWQSLENGLEIEKRVFVEFIGNFSVKAHILFENQGFSRYL